MTTIVFDAHTHLFHPRVVKNVKKKTKMVQRLRLRTAGVEGRTSRSSLENDFKSNGIIGGLVLPTALVHEVQAVNDSAFERVKDSQLNTAGTLHPGAKNIPEMLCNFEQRNIKAIKFCSFSQRFSLQDPKTFEMLERIQEHNIHSRSKFFLIFDTLMLADFYFGSDPAHNTTPELLGELTNNFPSINFIGAHMGGLLAPFKDIKTYLKPASNLFLDTSNGAHVLDENQYIELIKKHGPEHIIFGTDWPWFTHREEIRLQHTLFDKAGFTKEEKACIFANNILQLLA
jgi:uncharacterized protein